MRIALAGNPNSGKTTLFNAITGKLEYVGNWAGVTVDKKEALLKGYFREEKGKAYVVDLPERIPYLLLQEKKSLQETLY